ncbi:hypothetical protein CROQUDRAFT_540349 [Cronartium quercuum f. sp. fusiforme G11]|uniref:Uncharacterized protein n=1 Tax=Cronartium quercuum f. sp. fusiforme G11 TaxID=708437 RepID=A0A9P6TI25_9BASI|nr:hypothetical protein CROQUDRAFT_540349 [Cronartium quercuum f. sp. fusiforme G11]
MKVTDIIIVMFLTVVINIITPTRLPRISKSLKAAFSYNTARGFASSVFFRNQKTLRINDTLDTASEEFVFQTLLGFWPPSDENIC